MKRMGKNNRYYFEHMNKAEQSVYEAMLSGFIALDSSIRALRLPGSGLSDVFFRLKLDNPDIFFVKGISYRWVQDADFAELLPEYMFEKKSIRDHQQGLESRLKKLTQPMANMEEGEKERYIHDFICGNVRYDKLKKSYSHEIIGPLQNGVGVCEGIAKTVKAMCDRTGLECMIAVSRAPEDGTSNYLHAWNIVKLGAKNYHLDATFDNSLTGGGAVRYDYFNLDDGKIFRDHRPLLYPAPACTDGDHTYYRLAGLSWTREEDVEKRVAQALKKKKKELLFQWRGGYLTREKLLELVKIINGIAAQAEKGVQYSVNWPQAVIRLNFTDNPTPEPAISTQYADEAEGEINI